MATNGVRNSATHFMHALPSHKLRCGYPSLPSFQKQTGRDVARRAFQLSKSGHKMPASSRPSRAAPESRAPTEASPSCAWVRRAARSAPAQSRPI
eukprot:637099-Pleurochrysis_carterae.AAC.1